MQPFKIQSIASLNLKINVFLAAATTTGFKSFSAAINHQYTSLNSITKELSQREQNNLIARQLARGCEPLQMRRCWSDKATRDFWQNCFVRPAQRARNHITYPIWCQEIVVSSIPSLIKSSFFVIFSPLSLTCSTHQTHNTHSRLIERTHSVHFTPQST